ncbi:hypothetical protein [Sinorhizobium meliloti]|uniref:hypothetical protein n=1 Tax=Rhizobium meliloti TaxID=382 RepID=UPI001F39FE9A|nr:hypothetical protein [Sinorhizobium meliloti]
MFHRRSHATIASGLAEAEKIRTAYLCRVNHGANVTLTWGAFPAIWIVLGGRILDTPENKDGAAEPPIRVKSVAATILGEFFDVLQEEEGFEEVAPKLRKVVLEDGVFAEPSIRAALFPDAS